MKTGLIIAAALAAGGLSPFVTTSAAASALAPETPIEWDSSVNHRPPAWYASDEARGLAAIVVRHQSVQGGWPKNTDLFAPPAADADPGLTNTIDNNATTLPLTFLAKVIAAGDATPRAAFDKGIDYLLDAQYPNGGWPQYYPLRGGYYDAVTFNDDAMANVLNLLLDVAAAKAPYGFVDGARRARAAEAVRRGVDVIVKSQLRQNGRLTAWCAQHDPVTLAPAPARRFEPASLSGNESVGLVRFLVRLEDPSPEVIAAVDAAVAWFQAVAIPDVRIEAFRDAQGAADRRIVAAPGAGPLWARFYALQDNRPIFTGRDGIPRASLAEIEQERRAGYHYYGDWPKRLLERDYPAWQAQLQRAGVERDARRPDAAAE